MTEHQQVPFTTLTGHMVGVDEGLLGVLEELRRLGVKTQYSCQGDPRGAYVLADTRSFLPLLRKIRRNYRRGLYTSTSRMIVESFIDGYHNADFGLYFNKGTYRALKFSYKKGRKMPKSYCIEHDVTNTWGVRLCVRWPKENTDFILRLLKET